MRTLAAKSDHPSRSVLNAACGGLWMNDRRPEPLTKTPNVSSVRTDLAPRIMWCLNAQPSRSSARKQTLEHFGRMFPLFPEKLAPSDEIQAGTTTDMLLLTDGSGKHPAEPTHRKCGCGVSGETTQLSYPLPGCWQSVYKAELHAIMVACERLQGHGVVVTDCKGAAVVANKLKLGTRRPRGRHSRVEHRIQAAIGDIE
eukprot:1988565-Amphidinium_carterae.1